MLVHTGQSWAPNLNRMLKDVGLPLDPFSNPIYDLPLTSIAAIIDNLPQLLEEHDLPPPVMPIGGVLR